MSSVADRLRKGILQTGLRALSATWRIREQIPADCIDALQGREPVVIAFWHGAMLPVWYRFRNHGAAAIISASRDGELLSGYLRSLGYRWIVRGSSSRGGSQALAEGVEHLADRSLMITPDGPRGPAGEAKAGALIAATRSRRRILLVGCRADSAMSTSSWDRMTIPLPFSTVVLRYCILTPSNSQENRIITEQEIQMMAQRLTALSGTSGTTALEAATIPTGDFCSPVSLRFSLRLRSRGGSGRCR